MSRGPRDSPAARNQGATPMQRNGTASRLSGGRRRTWNRAGAGVGRSGRHASLRRIAYAAQPNWLPFGSMKGRAGCDADRGCDALCPREPSSGASCCWQTGDDRGRRLAQAVTAGACGLARSGMTLHNSLLAARMPSVRREVFVPPRFVHRIDVRVAHLWLEMSGRGCVISRRLVARTA